jgi:hypothetical protein
LKPIPKNGAATGEIGPSTGGQSESAWRLHLTDSVTETSTPPHAPLSLRARLQLMELGIAGYGPAHELQDGRICVSVCKHVRLMVSGRSFRMIARTSQAART